MSLADFRFGCRLVLVGLVLDLGELRCKLALVSGWLQSSNVVDVSQKGTCCTYCRWTEFPVFRRRYRRMLLFLSTCAQYEPKLGCPKPNSKPITQGSLHYTPKHCLVNGGKPLYFGVEKATCFKWLQNGDLLRAPPPNLSQFQGDSPTRLAPPCAPE